MTEDKKTRELIESYSRQLDDLAVSALGDVPAQSPEENLARETAFMAALVHTLAAFILTTEKKKATVNEINDLSIRLLVTADRYCNESN